VTPVHELASAPYTVLGWEVPDVTATVKELGKAGVKFERYGDFMKQDELGIWVAPGVHQSRLVQRSGRQYVERLNPARLGAAERHLLQGAFGMPILVPLLAIATLVDQFDGCVQARFFDPMPDALGMSRIIRPSSLANRESSLSSRNSTFRWASTSSVSQLHASHRRHQITGL